MATEVVKKENKYQSSFEALKARKPSVAWIELVRESAMDRFESLGFPTVSDEEWKYTNLAQLSKQYLEPVKSNEVIDFKPERFSFPETSDSHIVLVDGI